MKDRERAAASDEALLAQIRGDPAGNDGRAAASELFGRYRQRIYVWCYRYVREHERALDLAQDVMLSAYRALDSFQERSRFPSWLFAIARNRCLSAVRAPGMLRDQEAELEDLPDARVGPDTEYDYVEEEAALLDLIRNTLEPREQMALALRCYERLPVDEITRLLAIEGASGARGVLQGARRKLRAALDRRHTEEERRS